MPAERTSALRATSLAAALVAASLLAGCESVPKKLGDLPFVSQLSAATAAPSPTADLPPPAPRTWPDAAQDVLNQRARGFGLVNAPELQSYLNGVYGRIKTQAKVGNWPGQVHLLASDSMQAFATGSGNIYVSMPWVTSAQSEDELAALLGHEFGHIYLHFHQLEGVVEDANQAAGWLAIGMALAKQKTPVAAVGWTDIDSLATVYTLGRGLATTVYSRSQETAADNFGLNVSLKMGYSYEHGMKAFLERMASWEEINEQREKQAQEEAIRTVRAQTAGQNPGNNIAADINGALRKFSFDVARVGKSVRSDHPETSERIDAMANAVANIPGIDAPRDPVTAPLDKARKERRTAALLANYTLAFDVIKQPKNPKALAQARQATSGATASHAVPLFALYTALNEQPAGRAPRVDPGLALEANFRSEPDRAWKIYQERSIRLQEARQIPAATRVMEQGMAYFRNAAEPWPDAVKFYGQTKGWDEAKRMAQQCGNTFRSMAQRCAQAAASPADIAENERKTKQKADEIYQKMFKPKS